MSLKGKLINKVAKNIYNHTSVGDIGEKVLYPLSKITDNADPQLEKAESQLYRFTERLEKKGKEIIDKSAQKSLELKQSLISIHPGNSHLWIYDRLESDSVFSSQYYVYIIMDDYDNVIYTAKSNKENKRFKIELFNSKNKKVGKIVRKRLSFHNPISMKNHYDYYIYIGKEKLGEIKQTSFLNKITISFNNDEIKAEKQKHNIYPLIDSHNNIVAEIHYGLTFSFIDYQNKEKELLYILLSLSL